VTPTFELRAVAGPNGRRKSRHPEVSRDRNLRTPRGRRPTGTRNRAPADQQVPSTFEVRAVVGPDGARKSGRPEARK
jgi:hypothetical protein